MAKASKVSKADIAKAQEKGMTKQLIIGLIGQVVMAYVLAAFISWSGGVGWMNGMVIAFWAWLGFVATLGVSSVLWEGKSMTLFWINMTHWLVVLLVQGAIIGAWY